jgi:penicillin-binding protein 1A
MNDKKKKKKRSSRSKKGSPKTFLRRAVHFLIFIIAFSVGGFAALLTIISRDLPTINSLADYTPPMVNRVFDADGNLIAEIFDQRRTVIPVERIPAHVKNAFLAAEDAQFYNHEGLDYQAILAALLNEVKRKIFGGARRGGSTITQQTAKAFLLSPEQTYLRKLKDMILAKQIEEALTKEEILHLYLNQIYFGHGAYGIEEAARTYYGVHASELTLGQSAVLASIPKSPNRINPFADTERVRSRREYVLEQMVKHRFASAAEAATAKKERIRIQVNKPAHLGTGLYFTEEVRRLLVKEFGQDRLTRGGLSIYTAMKSSLQETAERAVTKGLREVDKRQGYRAPLVRVDPDDRKRVYELLDSRRSKLFDEKRVYAAAKRGKDSAQRVWDLSTLSTKTILKDVKSALKTVKAVPALKESIVGAWVKRIDSAGKKAILDLGPMDAVLPFSTMKWARPFSTDEATAAPKQISDVLKVGDIVLVKILAVHEGKKKGKKKQKAWADVALEQHPIVEGALVAVDPHSHRVLAMVGGYDFNRSSFNRATQAKRQPGSGFKPFIYAMGIESKRFTSVGYYEEGRSRLITDAPKVFFDPWRGTKWAPRNSGNTFKGDITLRTCLTYSVNTCSISILEKIGMDSIHGLSSKLELIIPGTPFPRDLTLALGTGEVHPVQLVNAYTIFSNGGSWAPPVFLEKVKDLDGKILYEHQAEDLAVLSPQTSYIMANLMKSVVEEGTGKRAKALNRHVAGKTGTTNKARSAWFTGFTPSMVAGAYVGFDDNRSLGAREYGGKAALPIWLDFMAVAIADQPNVDFEKPDGIEVVAIEKKTGLRIASGPANMGDATDADSPLETGTPKEAQAEKETGASNQFKPPSLSDLISKVARAITQKDPATNSNTQPRDTPVAGNGHKTNPTSVQETKPESIPDNAYEEVFIEGTAPTETAKDEAPPPLELFEMRGGLGP